LGVGQYSYYARDESGNAPGVDKIGLFNSDGTDRPAALSYKVVADAISTQYVFDSEPFPGPDLFEFVYRDKTTGVQSLLFNWAAVDTSVTFTRPAGTTTATVT